MKTNPTFFCDTACFLLVAMGSMRYTIRVRSHRKSRPRKDKPIRMKVNPIILIVRKENGRSRLRFRTKWYSFSSLNNLLVIEEKPVNWKLLNQSIENATRYVRSKGYSLFRVDKVFVKNKVLILSAITSIGISSFLNKKKPTFRN